MQSRSDPVSKLIFELSKLPGIGEKTATRLSYHILRQSQDFANGLADAILKAKHNTHLCTECFTFTDQSPCNICSNSQRVQEHLCVVEKPADVLSIEQSGSFKGLYHVLHGTLSPLDGIGPSDLKITELLTRLQRNDSISEITLATNPSVEGEATALYLSRLIKPFGIKLTKLAHGLPVGSLLEFADKQTIGKAVENRMEMG